MASLRCDLCEVDWPAVDHMYARCPQCDFATASKPWGTPMDTRKAAALYYHGVFRRKYPDTGAEPTGEVAEQAAAAIARAEAQHALETIPVAHDIPPPERRRGWRWIPKRKKPPA